MTDLLEGLEEIRRLTVRPGDTLVLRFKQRLPRVVIEEITANVKAKLDLGEDVKIMILDQGTTLDVLEKTGDPLASETERIATAMRAAKEHPGKVVTVEDADDPAP